MYKDKIKIMSTSYLKLQSTKTDRVFLVDERMSTSYLKLQSTKTCLVIHDAKMIVYLIPKITEY